MSTVSMTAATPERRFVASITCLAFHSNPTPIPGCGRILVMDDEEMIINMAGRILARLGYETAFARNGSEAVTLYGEALKTDQPFDAVVLDLTVRGGMGGEEAIRHLLKIDPQAKVIVSSGYSDSPVVQDYKKYGFSAAAGKPYSLLELSQALDRVLNPSHRTVSA